MEKTDYIFIWGNTQGCNTFEGDMNALIKYTDNPWNEIKRMISVARNNKVSCYLSRDDIEHNIELGKKYLDKVFTDDFLKKVGEVCARHQQMFKELKTLNVAGLSNEDLFKYFSRAVDQWSDTIGYFRGTQMEPSQTLIDIINKSVNQEEASMLLLPAELDPMNNEQIDWANLLSRPYNEKTMLTHLEKYPWLVAYHFRLDQALHTMSERYEQDKDSFEHRDVPTEKTELKAKQEKIIAKYPEIAEAVHLLNKLSFARIELKVCWGGNDFYMMPLFAEIAKRGNESIVDIANYYLIKDVENLLNSKPLSKEEKENRKRCFAFFWKDGKATICSGEEAERLEKQELGSLLDTKDIKEFKGVSANPGKVTGTVKILGSNDVERARELRKTFDQGEILVTEMTQPNIMDIAKRAGGIITDEGGMLSHAAIISREFKIPCIVATKIATKVLKDGDMVEVDAEKGIVRIINS